MLAARDVMFLRDLLVDLGIVISGPVALHSDSRSAIAMSLDPVAFKKTKHILRAAEGLRDYVARLVFFLSFIPGEINMADILTKPPAVAVFNELMSEFDRYISTG